MKKQLLLFLFAVLPLLAMADKSGSCGTGVTYTYTEATQTLMIQGSGAMYDFASSNYAPWYSYRKIMKTLIIEDGVTRIGDYTFRDCSGLTSVTIPNSVTSIGYYAFYYCSGLTSVTIGNSVTSIGLDAFYGCDNIKTVTINSNSIVSKDRSYSSSMADIFGNQVGQYIIGDAVMSIGEIAFYGCSGLTSVTIPNSVTSIGREAFLGCGRLQKVIVPDIAAWCGIEINGYSANPLYYAKHLYSDENTEIKDLVIPNSVTTIGDYAFENCSSLTSVTIPNTVMSIKKQAFDDCNGLQKVIVPDIAAWCGIEFSSADANPLYYAKHLYSDENTEIKDLVIPNSVTSIGDYEFENCSGLTSVTIPNSVTSIGGSAFYYCSGLTSVTIPNSVTSIGNNAFNGCRGLTSVTIPNSVTSIGNYAFRDCSGLTSVTIGNSVTSIGSPEYSAFEGCNNMKTVTINSNSIVSKYRSSSSSIATIFGNQVEQYIIGDAVTSIGYCAFYNCSGLTAVTIGNSVTSIGSSAFSGCSGLTAVTIPNSVTGIGATAFYGCRGLQKVIVPDIAAWCGIEFSSADANPLFYAKHLYSDENTEIKDLVIPNSVTSIGGSAFKYCSSLTSVTIPNSVTSIGDDAFNYCLNLTDVTLNSNSVASANQTSSSSIWGNQVTNLIFGDEVTSIGDYAFYNIKNLKSISIPQSVTSIGKYAFAGIANNAIVTIGENITNINSSSFPSSTIFHTKHKTKTLFALWNSNFNNTYEQETSKSIAPPYLKIKTSTQTSLAFEIQNMYNEYTYEFDGNNLTNNLIEVKNLYPAYSFNFTVYVKYIDMSYACKGSFNTQSLYPSVKLATKTASSLSVNGKRTKGDAEISKITISLNGKTIEGENIAVTGLNPNTSYKATYTITIKYGENLKYTRDYTASSDFKTDALTLTTLQPKVISLGNAIVAATANVDDEEKNVGFEWRRTDWSSDFASNTGTAYLFEGTMEGYIRNLNTDKLWKFRPYYLADNGTYYYGDWIGLDPTNISYFEPTVHTYSQIGVKGNTALIKGYALGGSDDITVQGFKYWKNAGSGSNRVSSTDIPGTANTVEASGTIMEVSLSNLDYESSYSYVAFATTSKGTYYGEIKTFDTDSDPTGINGIKVDNATTASVHEIARYNMQGRRITTPEKGVNIIKMSDGTTKKVFVK